MTYIVFVTSHGLQTQVFACIGARKKKYGLFFFVAKPKKEMNSVQTITTPSSDDRRDCEKGYRIAVKYGTGHNITQWTPPMSYGFNSGMYELRSQLAREALILIDILLNNPDMGISFVTPPLNAYRRRCVHLILNHAVTTKMVRTSTMGPKEAKHRRMRIMSVNAKFDASDRD